MIATLSVAGMAALWWWWPRSAPAPIPPPIPVSNPIGWEKDLVAKGIQIETKRLDALLHDDLSVDAFWDTLIRPSCQIYWVTREDPDQVTNLSLGDPALAYNQLALIAGYGKRANMPELHVGICSFKMAADRMQLETLSLQLKAK